MPEIKNTDERCAYEDHERALAGLPPLPWRDPELIGVKYGRSSEDGAWYWACVCSKCKQRSRAVGPFKTHRQAERHFKKTVMPGVKITRAPKPQDQN